MMQKKRVFSRRRVCRFCADKELVIDYKNPQTFKSGISDRGKIIPRRIFGTCARHQRQLNEAVKRARHLALIPYTGPIEY